VHYVYILQSEKDGSYYKGCTDDLKKRIEEHNSRTVKYTSGKAPYKLAWYCAFKDRNQALDFESYLKHGSGWAFAKKHLL
jgi:predicted GIY-YIG superfamily endonuclease